MYDFVKKAWIDFLYYDVAKQTCDFRLSSTWQDSQGEIHFSKWRRYLDAQGDDIFISKCNQREQLLHEVVLDLDDGDFNALIQRLKKDNVQFFAFSTKSGRARHIHTFWRGILCLPKYKRELIREKILHKYGCDPAFKVDSHLVPLEFCNHWKTAEKKILICKNFGAYDE